MVQIQVLIAGGGPAGLAAAAELALHGVASTVVEPRPSVSMDRPRAKTTSVRTMEHFRRWGVVDAVRAAAALTPDWSDRVVFCFTVTDDVLTSFSNVFGLGPETMLVSPEFGQQIPQPVVERVMRDHLARSPLVTMIYGSTVTALIEAVDGVTATVTSADGDESTIHAEYVLGCDGAAGVVRKAIGVRYVGGSDPRPNFNVLFRTDELNPPMGDAVHYWVVGGGSPCVIGRLDLDGLWWLIAPGVEYSDGSARIAQMLTDLVGHPIAHEVVSTDSWTARLLVAERFQTSRVFLVGESAHLNPPWGGHGYNTSIGDAVNIGWKLAAVLQGWAAPDLLDSYETERRPVAEQTIAIARANMRSLPLDFAAQTDRAVLAEAIQSSKDSEFHSLGLVLGYRYSSDGSTDPVHYTPSTDPGSRLPHARYRDGRSLFDALGPGYTLIAPEGDDVEPIRQQAAGLGIPLTVIAPPEDYPWRGQALLVRPDQHVDLRAASANGIDLRDALALRNTVTERRAEAVRA